MTAAWLAVLAAVASSTASASPPETSRLFLGLAIGEPVGVTIAAPVFDHTRVHLSAGLSTSEDRDGLVTFDFGYDLDQVIGEVVPGIWLIPWFGLGVRYAAGSEAADSDQLGLRAPFGLSYLDVRTPIEIFLVAAYGLVFLPATDASVELTLGLRFGL